MVIGIVILPSAAIIFPPSSEKMFHELSNQEVDSWIKLIRVLTHEIMNTITPVTSLSETLPNRSKD